MSTIWYCFWIWYFWFIVRSLIWCLGNYNLSEFIRHFKSHHQTIPPMVIKCIMYQILQGVNYLHEKRIIHRDIKSSNILLFDNDDYHGLVKIIGIFSLFFFNDCYIDFGLSRINYNPITSLTKLDQVVVTLWYRSPELLLGSRNYDFAIDIWAVGCIFAEVFCLLSNHVNE